MRRLPLYVFAGVQIMDATLTYVGIGRGFYEGNPLVAALMSSVGVAAALAIVKSVSITLGAFVFAMGYVRTLQVLTALYVVTALAPWTILLMMGV